MMCWNVKLNLFKRHILFLVSNFHDTYMYLTYPVFTSAGRCFMLFLIKLWNHHLVDGATVDKCLTVVDSYTPLTKS